MNYQRLLANSSSKGGRFRELRSGCNDGRTIYAHLLSQTALNTVAASILLLKQCCVKYRFAVKMTQKGRGEWVSTTAFLKN
jgi:hypothetical protein